METTQNGMVKSQLVGTNYVIAAGLFLIAAISVMAYRINAIDTKINQQTAKTQQYIYNNMYKVEQDQKSTIRELAKARSRIDM